MITKELLHKNVQYVKENKDKLNYSDDPLPMFNKDGKFDSLNWNGGDDVIRQLFYDIESGCDWKAKVYQTDKMLVVINFDIQGDERYGKITTIELDNHSLCFEYEFEWYKHRGTTELAKIEDKLINEETYIKLLNQIEEITEYKFQFYVK